MLASNSKVNFKFVHSIELIIDACFLILFTERLSPLIIYTLKSSASAASEADRAYLLTDGMPDGAYLTICLLADGVPGKPTGLLLGGSRCAALLGGSLLACGDSIDCLLPLFSHTTAALKSARVVRSLAPSMRGSLKLSPP